MKTRSKILNSALSLTTVLLGGSALANALPGPRGPEILPTASNCGIGPIGQTTKATPYNEYCTVLTDAEKCLALIKYQMSDNGEITPTHAGDRQEKAKYCIETFRKELLGSDQEQ